MEYDWMTNTHTPSQKGKFHPLNRKQALLYHPTLSGEQRKCRKINRPRISEKTLILTDLRDFLFMKHIVKLKRSAAHFLDSYQ